MQHCEAMKQCWSSWWDVLVSTFTVSVLPKREKSLLVSVSAESLEGSHTKEEKPIYRFGLKPKQGTEKQTKGRSQAGLKRGPCFVGMWWRCMLQPCGHEGDDPNSRIQPVLYPFCCLFLGVGMKPGEHRTPPPPPPAMWWLHNIGCCTGAQRSQQLLILYASMNQVIMRRSYGSSFHTVVSGEVMHKSQC